MAALAIWVVLWAIAMVFMAVYRWAHTDPVPKAKPKEEVPVPRAVPSPEELVRQAEGDFNREMRILRGMDLDPDEREAAEMAARQRLITKTRDALN